MELASHRQIVWGRSITPDKLTHFTILSLVIFAPLLTFYLNSEHITTYSSNSLWILLGWIAFQLILAQLPDVLHYILPSYKGNLQEGQLTPAGHQLTYQINGLQAWMITHILFYLLGFRFKVIDPSIIANNWWSLLISANILAYIFSIFVHIKALVAPTYPRDNKITGYWYYDYAMGIEFNPRIGHFDFKLFFNGRPGIIAWTLINLSFAVQQYQRWGYITDSMIVLNLLQALYVLDFFWNEKWYLKTIDIAHDHFGWILVWGDLVWLPFMYTLQAPYLARHPVILGNIFSGSILVLGLVGYIIFRWTNYQKDTFRAHLDKIKIWEKKPEYITCQFVTQNGMYTSYLLCSGFWGWARHFNYTGDLILSLCYCLTCGFSHLWPYFYFIYMVILLVCRCYRDEHRCSRKYGCHWQEYCLRVPYRLIPYLY